MELSPVLESIGIWVLKSVMITAVYCCGLFMLGCMICEGRREQKPLTGWRFVIFLVAPALLLAAIIGAAMNSALEAIASLGLLTAHLVVGFALIFAAFWVCENATDIRWWFEARIAGAWKRLRRKAPCLA